MGYHISDTPNSGSIPNDAFFEFENAAGEVQHVLGAVINAIIDSAQTEIEAATKYTVIYKAGSFQPAKSDGAKPYYRCASGIEVTIPTAAGGGFNVGDEITLYNVDSAAKTFDTSAVTINLPTSFTLGFNEQGSLLALICVGASEWDVVGDLSV